MDWYFAAAEACASSPQAAPLTVLTSPCLLAGIPAQTLTIFHKFPRLPPELRVRIWKFAMPPARSVKLEYIEHKSAETMAEKEAEYWEKMNTGEEEDVIEYNSPFLRAKHPNPALLHTNRESRHEALKTLKLSFGSTQIKPFYFDHSIDALQIRLFQFWDLFHQDGDLYQSNVGPTITEVNSIARLVWLDVSHTEAEEHAARVPLGRVFWQFPKLEYFKVQHDVGCFEGLEKAECIQNTIGNLQCVYKVLLSGEDETFQLPKANEYATSGGVRWFWGKK